MRRFILLLLQLLIVVVINAQTIKYTSANLNMREGPGSSYNILSSIPLGTSVKMEEECDCEWIKVYYNGNIGYVNSKYLVNDKSLVKTSNFKSQNNATKRSVRSSKTYDSAPAGATALCRDGTYSYSRNRRGTCSHHGGVARWL